MCEARAYTIKDGQERLVMEAVEMVEREGDGTWRLASIFGDQKNIRGRIMAMNLVDNKIIFEETLETA